MVDNCKHQKKNKSIIVTEAFAGYEVTRIYCNACEQYISPSKITVVCQ